MSRLEVLSGLQRLGFTDADIVREHLGAMQQGSEEDQHTYSRGLARALYAIGMLSKTLAEACNVRAKKFGRWRRGDSDSVTTAHHFHALMVRLFGIMLNQMDPQGENEDGDHESDDEDDVIEDEEDDEGEENNGPSSPSSSSNDEDDCEDDSEYVAELTQYLIDSNLLPPPPPSDQTKHLAL